MHTTALIASANESLTAANAQLSRKQAKKRSYISHGGVLTREEGAALAEAKANKTTKKRANKVTKSRKK